MSTIINNRPDDRTSPNTRDISGCEISSRDATGAVLVSVIADTEQLIATPG